MVDDTMPMTAPAAPPIPATTATTTAPAEPDRSPGSGIARSEGCVCSVLANAAYRERRESAPLVDPTCPLHAMP